MFFDWIRPSDSTTRTRISRSGSPDKARRKSRRRLELQQLEERRVLATWIGANNGVWSLDANWSGGVPDTAGETADFGAFTGNVVLDIANANIDQLNFGAGSNVSINAAVLGNTITTSAINQVATAGTNTIAARLSSALLVGVIDGGTLNLTNTASGANANNLAGTITVNSGATLGGSSVTGSNALGSANLNLNGGTLALAPTASATPGLVGRAYTGTNAITSTIDYTAAAAATRTDTVFTNANLTFANTTNATIQWTGKINITNPGLTTFFANSDDGSRIFIDGVLVVNNDGGKGVAELSGSINLAAGWHDIRVDYTNSGSGGSFGLSYTPAGGSKQIIPASVLFTPESATLAGASNTIALNNNVTLSASSTIHLVGTNFTSVGLNTLTASAGQTLNVTTSVPTVAGQQTGKQLRFNNTVLNAGATGTVTLNTAADVALGAVSDGGDIVGRTVTLLKQGAGTLIADNTLTAVDLNQTTIEVVAGGLRAVGGSTATSGTNNPLGTAAVRLNGSGVTMALDSKVGNTTFDNALDVATSATLQAYSGATTTTLGNAASTLTIGAGQTLTVGTFGGSNQTAGAVLQISSIVSGATGSLVKNNVNVGTNSNPGALILANPLNTYGGGTTINGGAIRFNSDGNLGLAGAGVLLNGGILQHTLNGTITPSRNITVGASGGTIQIDNNSPGGKLHLTAADRLQGSGTLTKSGPGVIQMGASNSFTGAWNIAAGVIEVQNATALGSVVGGNPVTISGGELVASANLNIPNNLTISSGSISTNSAAASFTGTINATGNFTVRPRNFQDTTTAGRIITLAGVISGTGTLTVDSSGAATPGTVRTIGSNILSDSAGVVITGNGVLDMQGFNDTVASFQLTNGTLTGTTGVLTSTANATLQTGIIQGNISAPGYVKTTNGPVQIASANRLGGTANVTVSGGNLIFGTFGSAGSASQTLGTVAISGTGTVTTVASGTINSGAVTITAFGGIFADSGAGNTTLWNTSSVSNTGGQIQAASGTLDFGANSIISNTPVNTNALDARLFENLTGLGFNTDAGIARALAITKPTNRIARTGVIDFPNDTAFSTAFGNTPINSAANNGGTNFSTLIVGTYTPVTSGTHTFSLSHDDGTALWIDLDEDGVFESAAGELVVNATGTTTLAGSTSLTANKAYRIAILHEETAGGSRLAVSFQEPAGPGAITTLTTINPSTQPGRWNFNAPPAISIYPGATFAAGSVTGAPTVDFNNVGLQERVYRAPFGTTWGGNEVGTGTAGVAPSNFATIEAGSNSASLLNKTPVTAYLSPAAINNGTNGTLLNEHAGSILGSFLDRFAVVAHGYITVGGPNLPAGVITFGVDTDDAGSIWIDDEGDGVFEAADRIASTGNTQSFGTRTLAAGTYRFLVAQQENAGGERINAKIGAGTFASYAAIPNFIDPTAASQAGIYSLPGVGTGTLKLSSSAPTTSTLGTVMVGGINGNGAIPRGTLDFGINNTVNVANLNVGTGSVLNRTGAGTLNVTGSDTFSTSSTTNIVDGLTVLPVASTGDGTINIGGNGTLQIAHANAVSSATAVNINSGGRLNVAVDNAVLGNVSTLAGGFLRLSNAQDLGAGATLPTTAISGTLEINNTAIGANYDGLQLANGSSVIATVAGATYASDLSLVGGTATFNSAPNSFAVSGTVSGAGNLNVAGPNVVTLSGTGSYVGSTTVTSGTLALVSGSNNNIANTTGVQINSGAQLDVAGLTAGTFNLGALQTLSGSGTLAGNLTGDGTIAPQADAGTIGVLTVTGNVDFAGNVNLEVNAPYSVAGTHYDQLVAQGALVDLTGATINLAGTATAPAANQVIKLVDKTSAGLLSPAASPANGSIVTPGGGSFRLYYNGGADGNDVVLASTVLAAGSTIYVNDEFSGGAVDGDLETAGLQPAYFGIDAFASVQDALAANPNFTGIIVINGGVYTTATNLDQNGAGAIEVRLVQDLTNNELNVTLANLTGSAGDSLKTRFGAANANLTLDQGNFAGVLSGAGSVTKTGAGTLTLSGANTAFTGGIVINGGSVNFSADNHLGAASSGITLNGGTLNSTPTTGQITFNHVITVNAAGGTLNVSGNGTAGKLLLPSAGLITGTGTLTKTGNGVLQMTSANNGFSGAWIIQGLIEDQNANALGNLSVTNIVTVDGGELVASGVTVANNLIVKNNGSLSTNSASATFSGTIDAQGDFFLRPRNFQDTGTVGRTINLTNVISGAGAMKIDSTGATSAGTVVVSNTANTFSGGVQIINGILRLGATNALPTNTSIAFGAQTTGGTLDLAGFNQQVNTLTVAGALIRQVIGNSSTASNSLLTVTGNTNFSGTIVDALGSGTRNVALAVAGGNVTLSGSNRYSGGTNILSGTLTGTAPGTLGTGTVTEHNGTTLTLNPAISAVSGFGVNGAGWTLNGGATVASDVLTVTTAAGSQARTAYFNQAVPTNGFTTSFVYSNPNTLGSGADGFTFVLEGDARGATAVGAAGGGLGIGGVAPSVGLAFNNYTPNTRGIRFFTNGVVGTPYTAPGSVVVGNGTPISVALTYDGTTLTWTLTQGSNTYTNSQAVNIPAIVGDRAFVGFSGGTGGQVSLQTVSNFAYNVTTPVAVYPNSIALAAGATANLQIGATAASPTITAGSLAIGTGATLNVSATSSAPANLAYGANFGATSFAGNSTLNLANNGSGTGTVQLGALSDSGVAATLNKTGPGTLILNNGATGVLAASTVNVNNGTLLVNNGGVGSATGNATVNVAGGATLGGNGTMQGNVNVNVAGTLSPGMSPGAFGLLTIGGDLDLQSGSTYAVDITQAAFDQTTATNIDIAANVNLAANVAADITAGTQFVILDATSSATGLFAIGGDNDLIPGDRLVIYNTDEIYHLTNGDTVDRFDGVAAGQIALVRNDVVVAEANTYTMLQNSVLNGNVFADVDDTAGADSDPDQDAVVELDGSGPNPLTQGTLALSSDGSFTFTPIANFKGVVQFNYRLTDGENSSIATVTINVTNIAYDAEGNLTVGGETGDDRIVISNGANGTVAVRFNSILSTGFAVDADKKVIVYGNAGNDTITVYGMELVPVEFYGGIGNDYLAGGALDDILDGGDDTDRLLGAGGNDALYGGAGNDTLNGGAGNDTLYGDSYLAIDRITLLTPSDDLHGRDTLSGDAGDDFVYGEGNVDAIYGGLGSDVLRGGEGSDTVSGDDGNDMLTGDGGNDKLYGRAGDDVLFGGEGIDTMYGGNDADLMFGNSLDSETDAELKLIYQDWFGITPGGKAGAANRVRTAARSPEAAADLLYGEAGNDWYLLYFGDKISSPNESVPANTIETINP